MRRIVLVQLKAFGDLVIACAIAERVVSSERANLVLLIGSHLRELCDAMQPPAQRIEINVGERGVPSIFDFGKNGVFKALRSALRLRHAVAHAGLGSNDLLLFERAARRERFLSGSFETSELWPDAGNVYQGYVKRLSTFGLTLSAPALANRRRDGAVGIFPASRIVAKNLPLSLIREIVATIERQGQPAKLFLLSDERPDLERSGLPYTIVPRNFTAMLDAVRSVRAVVSADSMPAHMAEASGVPVFVFSPRANEYWLPQSAFEGRRWEIFANGAGSPRLTEMLAADQV